MGSQAVFLYLPFSRQLSGTFGRLALRTSGFPLPSQQDLGFPLTHDTPLSQELDENLAGMVRGHSLHWVSPSENT